MSWWVIIRRIRRGSASLSPFGAVTIDSYTYSEAGDDPTLTVNISTDSSDILDLYGSYVENPNTPTKAQLEAGSGGGVLEGFSALDVEDGSTVDITGLTGTSDTGDELHFFVKERNGPNSSAIQIETGVNPSFGSYTENSVTVTSGDYLTGTALPTDAKSALFFWSGVRASGAGAVRAALLNWDAFTANSGFYSDNNATADQAGIRASLGDTSSGGGGGGLAVADQSVTDGTRYHTLVSWWTDNDPTTPTFHMKVWLYNTSVGSWSQVFNSTDTTNVESSANLMFTPDSVRIFERSDSTGHPFVGTSNRLAMWTSTNPDAITDIDNSTVRNWFTDGSSTADPTTSQTNIAGAGITLHVDLNGPAADYNSGTHDGTMTLTPTGTFS